MAAVNASRFWSVVGALVRRDLLVETRKYETLTALATFALIVLTIFSLALNPIEKNLAPVFSGLYWLAITFATLVALGRTFGREREAGMLEALATLPADGSAVYVAKVIVTAVWSAALALLVTPLFLVLLDIEARPPWGQWALVVVAGVFGIVVTGTLLAALSAHARGGDLLLPLLLLPLIVPVLLASVRLSEALLVGADMADAAGWFRLLIGYDIVFFVVALVLFDFVVEV